MPNAETNPEKVRAIRAWIDPDERVTVDFSDERNLNAEVVDCTDDVVELAVDAAVPHLRQRVIVPLRLVTVSDDPWHYTRDPSKPLRHSRLRLSVDRARPKGDGL